MKYADVQDDSQKRKSYLFRVHEQHFFHAIVREFWSVILSILDETDILLTDYL